MGRLVIGVSIWRKSTTTCFPGWWVLIGNMFFFSNPQPHFFFAPWPIRRVVPTTYSDIAGSQEIVSKPPSNHIFSQGVANHFCSWNWTKEVEVFFKYSGFWSHYERDWDSWVFLPRIPKHRAPNQLLTISWSIASIPFPLYWGAHELHLLALTVTCGDFHTSPLRWISCWKLQGISSCDLALRFYLKTSRSRHTPPKFNSSPLQDDGWKTSLSFLGFGNFSGASC